jgi:hypothetical protein
LSKGFGLALFGTMPGGFSGISYQIKLYVVVVVIKHTFSGGKFLNVKGEKLPSRLGSSLMVAEALTLGLSGHFDLGFKKQNVIP